MIGNSSVIIAVTTLPLLMWYSEGVDLPANMLYVVLVVSIECCLDCICSLPTVKVEA